MKDKLKIILYACLLCIFTVVMFLYIDKKEGFHEDEIFSYGASNSKYNSILLPYGRVDGYDYLVKRRSVFETFKNWVNYVADEKSAKEKEAEFAKENRKSVWRTREDARELVKIDNISEATDFFTVYWNTARDVHPPLFYFAVHIMSILFFNTFSKYIIFYINLLFFLATCVMLIKIIKRLGKEYLAVPLLIFYGLSCGAISSVIFQRMYMMLAFFTVWFLYTNLKIYYNNFKLDKKLKLELCAVTILGFLTQYYFCVYAAFIAIIMIIIMVKRKQKDEVNAYMLQFIKSAVIGVLLFVSSLSHIFVSYRGVNGDGSQYTFIERLIFFAEETIKVFGLQNIIGILVAICLGLATLLYFKNKEDKNIFAMITIPIILYYIVIAKLSPYKSLRYIMNILPVVAVAVVYILDNLFKNKKVILGIIGILAICVSVYGLRQNNVECLYTGYNKYLEVAEEYKDNRYVLIATSYFNHIANIQEMMIYKESLILMPRDLEELKENQELRKDNEFILSIRDTIKNKEKVLQNVLEYTNFSDYELLIEPSKEDRYTVYKIYNK